MAAIVEDSIMRNLVLVALCLILVGCRDQIESQSPTESEKLMLQCKDNLSQFDQWRPLYFEDSSDRKFVKTLPEGRPGCPATDEDTYSESYNPKTGEVYCKGHHHQKVGLEADYPRLVAPPVPKEEGMMKKYAHRLQSGSDFAPNVKENESGITPIPTGFPLPLYAPVEVLSSTTGRLDGVFKVYLRYDGDLEHLEEKWRKLLNDQVLDPHQSDEISVWGSTPLGNQISVRIELKTSIIRVSWEPAFLINDLAD
jgi:hypothetical protein